MDILADALGIRMRPAGKADAGRGAAEGADVALVKPQTFMNLSGEAVAPLFRRHGLSPEELVVVHDDLDIPAGRVRLKRGGGTGGHNGLKSLEEALGTRDFLRVRIGIGRPPEGVDPADYVLGPPAPESRDPFRRGVADAARAVQDVLRDGFDRAMTRWNAKKDEAQSADGVEK